MFGIANVKNKFGGLTTGDYICLMDKKKTGDGRERVALNATVVQMVRDNKEYNEGPSISAFFETAAVEKLARIISIRAPKKKK